MSNEALSNLLHEDRRFAPPTEFAAAANVTADAYAEAETEAGRLAFWEKHAVENVHTGCSDVALRAVICARPL